MFRLERPEYLWIILLIPAFLWINSLLTSQKKKRLSEFGNLDILSGFNKDHLGMTYGKLSLICIAITCISIAMTNPQFGSNKHTVDSTSSDIFILMDLSRSMTSDDIKPSRLEKAKNFAASLVERLRSNRIGLVIFAGRAYLQMPLTDDFSAAATFVSTTETEMVPTQGTAIGPAIELALRQFDFQAQTNKSIIILSDGEDQDAGALDAAKFAKKRGVQIYTIGVGTPSGGFMTIYNSGRADFKRDEEGNPVRTKLDEAALMQIAKEGSGNYYDVRSGEDAIVSLAHQIEFGARKDGRSRSYYDYESYFQWFLLVALIALLFAWYDIIKVRLKPLRKAYLLIPILFLSCLGTTIKAQELLSEARKAEQLYKEGRFPEAETKFDNVARKNPKDPKFVYNKANAQSKQKKYKEAIESYDKVLESVNDNKLKNRTLFNKGNAHFEQKQYVESIHSYIEALKINPYDLDTKKNLSLAFKKFQQEQEKKQQKDKENKDQNKDQEKQSKKDKQDQNQQEQKNNEQEDKSEAKSKQQKKEETERLLKIIDNEEKNVLKKLPKESETPPVNGKDW